MEDYVTKAKSYLDKMLADDEFCNDGNRNSSAVDFVIAYNIVKANETGISPIQMDEDDLVYHYTKYLRSNADNYDYQMVDHLERVAPYGQDWWSLDDHGLCKMIKYHM